MEIANKCSFLKVVEFATVKITFKTFFRFNLILVGDCFLILNMMDKLFYLFSAERLVDAEMVAVEQRKSEVDVNPHARVVAGLVWGTFGPRTRQAASPYKVYSQHLSTINKQNRVILHISQCNIEEINKWKEHEALVS